MRQDNLPAPPTKCQPPICTADGWCTPDLLGFDPNAPVETTVPTDPIVVDETAVDTTTGDQTNG